MVSPNGISSPLIQDFNNANDVDLQKIIFNTTGDKLMQITLRGFMCEFDFDRCTGILSSPNVIYPEAPNGNGRYFWEGAYSSNNTVFYISTTNVDTTYPYGCLLQYDLNAANIPASCDTLDCWHHPVGSGAVRLAPDKKIYFSRAYEWGFPLFPYPDTVYNTFNMNLSIINSPDSLGSACDYQPHSFYLNGKRTYYGLPLNPDYSLAALTGSICDTLNVGVVDIITNNSSLFVYYDTEWKKVFINAQKLTGKNVELKIYNLSGQIIYTNFSKTNDGYFTHEVNMQSFSSGLYIISLQTEKEKLGKKFVKN